MPPPPPPRTDHSISSLLCRRTSLFCCALCTLRAGSRAPAAKDAAPRRAFPPRGLERRALRALARTFWFSMTLRNSANSISPLLSSSTSAIMRKTSSSVGFCPSACSVALSSVASMVPEPSRSNLEKASRQPSISACGRPMPPRRRAAAAQRTTLPPAQQTNMYGSAHSGCWLHLEGDSGRSEACRGVGGGTVGKTHRAPAQRRQEGAPATREERGKPALRAVSERRSAQAGAAVAALVASRRRDGRHCRCRQEAGWRRGGGAASQGL